MSAAVETKKGVSKTWQEELEILVNSIKFTAEDLLDISRSKKGSTINHKLDLLELVFDLQRSLLESIEIERDAAGEDHPTEVKEFVFSSAHPLRYEDPNFWLTITHRHQKWHHKIQKRKEMDRIFAAHCKVLAELYKEHLNKEWEY